MPLPPNEPTTPQAVHDWVEKQTHAADRFRHIFEASVEHRNRHGCNVYPSQVEAVLLTIKEAEPHYLLVIRREKNLDTMEIMVEGKKEVFAKGKEAVAAIEKKIKFEIHQIVGITATVRLVEPKTIERSIGKAKRVLDERPK